MTKLNSALISSALLLALSGKTFADGHAAGEHSDAMAKPSCETPATTPIIPDGNVASLDELIAAQTSVKAFQSDLVKYRECISAGLVKDAVEEQDIQKNAALNAAYDASVDSETAVVNEFSTARVAYQARQPKKK